MYKGHGGLDPAPCGGPEGSGMQERVWIKHYDPGIAPEIEVPEIPLHRFLEETARKYPNRTATILKGARLSYAELDQLTDRLAAGLAAMGLQRGDRGAIFVATSPVVRTVFPLFMEKKMGHRVELEAGDEWFQDVLARHSPEQRPQLALGPDDVALLQYTGGTPALDTR